MGEFSLAIYSIDAVHDPMLFVYVCILYIIYCMCHVCSISHPLRPTPVVCENGSRDLVPKGPAAVTCDRDDWRVCDHKFHHWATGPPGPLARLVLERRTEYFDH